MDSVEISVDKAYEWLTGMEDHLYEASDTGQRERTALQIYGAISFYKAAENVDFSDEQMKHIDSIKRNCERYMVSAIAERNAKRTYGAIERLVSDRRFRKMHAPLTVRELTTQKMAQRRACED